MDDDDSSTNRNVENIMASLDTSADGRINQDEFIKGMTKLVSDISNQTPVNNSQVKSHLNNVFQLIAERYSSDQIKLKCRIPTKQRRGC